jgi:FKBP-type peptidyl-prolyl cis-trans isomerase
VSSSDQNQTFLADNKAKAGVVTTASGLQYQRVKAGDESIPSPALNDTVRVHYEGALIDGSVFDSSYKRGQPIDFRPNQVIPGWTEALQLMHPGDEFRIVLKPELGYGAAGAGGVIPGNAVLVFKVEMLGYRTADGRVAGQF